MHNFNLSATTGIFHLLEAINKRKIFSLQVKHRFINIAKTKLGSCSEEEIAGAFVRLHYRLHELAKFNGQLYEVDTAIGYEDPEKVDAFVRSVKNSYIKFFNNYRFSESDSAESSSSSDKTETNGEPTVDSATAMTDSLFALASNS
jgi:hypothetical protein|tara:strand:- start:49 stop:486 length:438 start_codon:yes stop_codon:yes gene_type:complete